MVCCCCTIFFTAIIVALIGLLVRYHRCIVYILYYIYIEIIHYNRGTLEMIDDWFHRNAKLDIIEKRGHTALITGGTRGIGAEVIKYLLQCDMHVIVGCRKVEAGRKVEDEARKEGIKTGTVEVLTLDVSSLKSIREFAKIVTKKYPKINLLINNAAVLTTKYEETVDGFESQFGVNYLGHFLLTHLLLPNIIAAGKEGAKSRIVNVASCTQYFAKINFDDIHTRKMFINTVGYSQSKLAQVVSTRHLNAELSKKGVPVDVFAVHPGVVNTEMLHVLPVNSMAPFISLLYKSPKQGAIPIVYTAISADLEGKGGSYTSNCRIKDVNPQAKSKDVQEKLFKLSKEMAKIDDFYKPDYNL